MNFDQIWLHKTHDFGQIQNSFDQDSGLNATITETNKLIQIKCYDLYLY
jgi:hypothetical protein